MRILAICLAASLGRYVAAVSLVKRACETDAATVGYAVGTTGGIGGTTTTVSDLASLTAAVSGNLSKIVFINGTIVGDAQVQIGNNTSIIGKAGSELQGIGLRVRNASNVIIRNVKISNVIALDCISIETSNKVWVDHVDLYSDRDHGKDYYDGLIDITRASTAITVTWSKLSGAWKGSLVGHSDTATGDTVMTVTYGLNWWTQLNSRVPTVRFGRVHIYNNYFLSNNDGINARMGAQLLIQANVWENCTNTVYPTDGGAAVLQNNLYGNATAPTTPTGNFTIPPYTIGILPVGQVKAAVTAGAGQKLAC